MEPWRSTPIFQANSPFDAVSANQSASPSPNKRISASSLLSLFKAKSSPTSVSQKTKPQPLSLLKQVHSTMSSAPAEGSSSEGPNISSGSPAIVCSIQATTTTESIQVDDDDDDDVLPNIDVAIPSRVEDFTPTRSQPTRSTRSKVKYAISPRPNTPKATPKATPTPRTKKQKAKAAAANRIVDSDMQSEQVNRSPAPRVTKLDTVRNRVREEIATTTKAKRDAFLVHHQDYFLPLLPPNNHISKLVQAGVERQSIVPHTQLDKQPTNVTATMKPYQLKGLSFMVTMFRNAMPAILGDEMGLGKTLQTLSLIQYLEENHPTSADLARPYLVVCPLSVMGSWYDEARKWTPKLKVIRFHGSVTERNQLKSIAQGKIDRFGNNLGRPKKKIKRSKDTEPANNHECNTSFDLMITTYEAFLAEQTWLKHSFVWRYCILDEGHKIKNDKTNISHALQTLHAEHRLLLTGTPLQNDMREMWALLHWLYPEVFTEKTSEVFKEAFDLGRGQVDSNFMDHARHLLELVMIRRMKDSPGVDLGLPPKEEVLLYVPLTPVQRFWYTRLLTKAGDTLLDELFGNIKQKEHKALIEETSEGAQLDQAEKSLNAENDFTLQSRTIIQQAIASEATGEKETGAYKKLLNLVMQLRKACIHPYMIKGAAPEPYSLGDHIMHASGKFIVLSKIIDELVIERGKKILIFSGFTRTLDYCEDLLTTKGSNQREAAFRHVRLDGSTPRAMRNLQIRLFNDLSSDFNVMLISTRAGGLGLNLTSASDVIFLDEDWNPQVTLQAESRSHRIGQKNMVTIYKLCTQGTVEEQMMGRIRKKLYLSAKITESMQDIHSTPGESIKRKRSSGQNDMHSTTEDGPNLGASQLMTLIRRGATTLTHSEINVSDMVDWDLKTIIEKCKDKPVGPHVGTQPGEEHADEQEWLAKMERVECAVFDGIKYQRQVVGKTAPSEDLRREDRRAGKNTTVMIDGFAINKESMGCADWEAVPTLAGKDPRLATPKREKALPIEHQEECQVCFDGGEVYLCSLCPRIYHFDCLPDIYQAKAQSKSNFVCSQHNCIDCERNTTNAGGLIYRCRWCHRGYCEDCLDFSKAELLGETLPEYELLGFATKRNAWYIHCHECLEIEKAHPENAKFISDQAHRHVKEYTKRLEQQMTGNASSEDLQIIGSTMSVSRAESMTEATTHESSGQITPQVAAAQGKSNRMSIIDPTDETGNARPPTVFHDVQAEPGADWSPKKRRFR